MIAKAGALYGGTKSVLGRLTRYIPFIGKVRARLPAKGRPYLFWCKQRRWLWHAHVASLSPTLPCWVVCRRPLMLGRTRLRRLSRAGRRRVWGMRPRTLRPMPLLMEPQLRLGMLLQLQPLVLQTQPLRARRARLPQQLDRDAKGTGLTEPFSPRRMTARCAPLQVHAWQVNN